MQLLNLPQQPLKQFQLAFKQSPNIIQTPEQAEPKALQIFPQNPPTASASSSKSSAHFSKNLQGI
jgi:hypothetical protein